MEREAKRRGKETTVVMPGIESEQEKKRLEAYGELTSQTSMGNMREREREV